MSPPPINMPRFCKSSRLLLSVCVWNAPSPLTHFWARNRKSLLLKSIFIKVLSFHSGIRADVLLSMFSLGVHFIVWWNLMTSQRELGRVIENSWISYYMNNCWLILINEFYSSQNRINLTKCVTLNRRRLSAFHNLSVAVLIQLTCIQNRVSAACENVLTQSDIIIADGNKTDGVSFTPFYMNLKHAALVSQSCFFNLWYTEQKWSDCVWQDLVWVLSLWIDYPPSLQVSTMYS